MAVYLMKRGTINVSQNIHLVFYRRVSTVMSFTEGYSRHHRPFIHLLFIRPRCHRGSIANSSAVADVSLPTLPALVVARGLTSLAEESARN